MDLVTWLREQIDEDERLALLASPGPWHLNAEQDEVVAVDDIQVADAFALSSNQQRNTARHIALHDPARVLRQVKAYRAIVDALAVDLGAASGEVEASALGDELGQWIKATGIVRLLASTYSDRPGYAEAVGE